MPSQHQATDQLATGGSPLPPLPALPPQPIGEREFREWALGLDSGMRVEWVDGETIIMSPENTRNARLEHWLARVLGGFVEHHGLGEVIASEVLVRLPDQQSNRVPDLLFIAAEHADRVRPTHVEGPPDLCVEIVSPDSQARDWREKYLEYEAAGVREYWVIDPMSQHAEFYALEPNEGEDTPRYARLAERAGAIESRVLPGLTLPVHWLWKDTRPKVLDALRELGVIA